MRGQELLHILTKLDVKLVNEAAAPRRMRHIAWRLLAVAACLAVVAGTVLWQGDRHLMPDVELPLLTIEKKNPLSDLGGGGLGVVWVNTLDDIPAERLTPSADGTLPVYTHDGVSTDPLVALRRIKAAGDLLGLGEDAALTGTTVNGVEVEVESAYIFRLKDDNLELTANRDGGGVTVTFQQPIPLPEGYGFAEEYRPTKEELERLEPFFIDLCREKLNMSAPQFYITCSGVSNDGKLNVHPRCRQENGIDVILSPIDGTAVTKCYIYLPRTYIADYPIISEEEALERLEAGHYLGLSGYGTDERRAEERVDLLYYADQFQTVLMPYYRFFAFSHTFKRDDAEATISVYEEYYVPAVASEYLTALPEDGSAGGLPALPDATTTTTTTAATTTTTQPPNVPLVPVLPDNYGVLLRLYDGSPVYKTTAHAETIARARKLMDGATLKQDPDQEPIAGGWQLHVDFPDGTGYAITADGVVIDGTRYLPDDPDALIAAAEALWEDVDVPAESLLNYRPYTGE